MSFLSNRGKAGLSPESRLYFWLSALLFIGGLIAIAAFDKPAKKPCDCGDICNGPTPYTCGLEECPSSKR